MIKIETTEKYVVIIGIGDGRVEIPDFEFGDSPYKYIHYLVSYGKNYGKNNLETIQFIKLLLWLLAEKMN